MPPLSAPLGTMPPDILYLAWGRPQRPRANLIQTLHTVEALAAAGAGVRLYVPPLERDFDMQGFLAGMGLRHAIDIRGSTSLHRRWGGWPFMLLHRGELAKARVIYTRVPELALMLARWGHGHFLEVHDTATLTARGQLPRLLEAARRGLLHGLVAISETGREALVAAGFPRSTVHVLPSGVDLAAFAAAPALTPEEARTARCSYVGRISRDRGLPIFEAIAAAGFEVDVVGPRDDEPARPHPNLRVHKAVPHVQVPSRVAAGAIALMPYQADLQHAATISPIKLFEAMAAGRVVIASDLPPLREVIRDGENGLLVPADDPAAWIAAVERVRAEPEAALAMAASARRSARAYGWESRASKLLAITDGTVRQGTAP
jgi:glycosyltransferase involved in cell wall biosynthesis